MDLNEKAGIIRRGIKEARPPGGPFAA